MPPQMNELPLVAASMSALLALGELVGRRPNARNWVACLLFLCLAIVLLHAYLLFSGRITHLPHLYQVHIVPVFCMGPLLLGFFWAAARGRVPGDRRALLHFLPALVAALAALPLYLEQGPLKRARVEALFDGGRGDYGVLLFLLGLAHFATYTVVAITLLLRRVPRAALRTQSAPGIVVAIGVFALLISLLTVLALLSKNRPGIFAAVYSLSSMPFVVYLLGRRYPHFFFDLSAATNPERYRNSQLRSVDLDAVAERLDSLLKRERVYRDESLTLAGLAERLGLTSHQLSEYFNHHLGQSFSAAVNAARVAEARELLRSEPKRTVLSIAFAVGFNSKSSFNQAFARETGQTPTQFRRGGAS